MNINNSPCLIVHGFHASAYCPRCREEGRMFSPMHFIKLEYPPDTFFSHDTTSIYECYHGHRVELNKNGQDRRFDRFNSRFQGDLISYVYSPYIPKCVANKK